MVGQVKSVHFTLEHPRVLLTGQQTPDRRRNIGGTQAGHRDLVKQRLKKMVIAAVDQGDLNVCQLVQSLGRIQPGKATPDNHNRFHGSHSTANLSLQPVLTASQF
jgi:hypothetical protein